MDELRDKIIETFNVLKPRDCEVCKCIYNDTDNHGCMECFICDRRICPSCLPWEVPRFGMLPVCGDCEQKYRSKNKPKSVTIPMNTTVIPNILDDLTRDSILNSTMLNNYDKDGQSEPSNARNKESNAINTNSNPSNNKKPEATKVCGFYLNKKCRHGRNGKECHYLHPKLCYSYLNKGTDGCNKENCEYFHPIFCKFQEKCKSKECKFYHKKQPKKNNILENEANKRNVNNSPNNTNNPQNSHRNTHQNSHQNPRQNSHQNFQNSQALEDTSQN